MRKRSKILFFAVLICVVLACLLCACGKNPGSNPKTKTDEPKTQDGWEKIPSINKQEMFSQFLTAFMNVAYQLSDSVISDKKEVTLDSKLTLNINGTDFWVTVRGKYDRSDKKKIREKTILAAEISNEENVTNDSRLISVFLFKDELYVAVGDNKVKFPFSEVNWTEFFPFEMEKMDSDATKSVSMTLANAVVFEKLPSGFSRTNSNKKEYKYTLDFDVYLTLMNVLTELKKLFPAEKVESIQTFIASVLGVSDDEFEAGDVPESSMVLDFAISGSDLQALRCKVGVGLADSAKKLFGTDTLSVDLDLSKVQFTNDYNNGVSIAFANNIAEQRTYAVNSSAVYALSAPIRLYAGNTTTPDHYQLNVITRVLQGDQGENFLFLEYYDTEKRAVERALYVYRDKGYIISVVEDPETGEKRSECVYRFDVDLSDVANRVVANDLNGNAEFDDESVYKLIAYCLKSISIDRSQLNIRVSKDLFSDVWYNFSDMVNYVDAGTSDHGMKENAQVVEFLRYLTTNEIILCISFSDSELMNIIQENDASITTILGKLTEYDRQADAAKDSGNGEENEGTEEGNEDTTYNAGTEEGNEE